MRKFTQIYSKVMNIVLLIVGIILSITTVIFALGSLGLAGIYLEFAGYSFAGIPLLIFAIFELINTILTFVASGKFKKVKNASDEELFAMKGKLLGWGIYVSIALWFPVSIFVFLPPVIVNHIFIGKLQSNTEKEQTKQQEQKIQENKYNDTLNNLQQLKNSGVLSEEEYNNKKAEIENKRLQELEAKKEIKDERTFGEKVKQGATNVVEGTKDVFGVKSSTEKLKEELEGIKELKEQGLITEEEYQAKKKKILGI